MIASVLLTLAGARSAAGDLVLVENGYPKSEICLSDRADAADRRAATMLRDWVHKMSGVSIPIIVRHQLGKGPGIEIGFDREGLGADVFHEPLSIDGYELLTIRGQLCIRSGGGKGSIYGVVTLLERYFGCHKYSPTAEVFPKRLTLSVPMIRVIDGPENSFRALNGEFTRDQDYLDWQRLNQTSELFGKGYYVHTFARLAPPAEFFNDHPEYFALIDGRRNPIQLCPSEPAVADHSKAPFRDGGSTRQERLVREPERQRKLLPLRALSGRDSRGRLAIRTCRPALKQSCRRVPRQNNFDLGLRMV
jgi:hypothetical protein